MVTLLLASSADVASINLHHALLRLGGWEDVGDLGHGELRVHGTRPVHLLLIEDLHINADGIDRTHEEATGCSVDEILVLSRHVSATEIPAVSYTHLTLPTICSV